MIDNLISISFIYLQEVYFPSFDRWWGAEGLSVAQHLFCYPMIAALHTDIGAFFKKLHFIIVTLQINVCDFERFRHKHLVSFY